MPYPYSPPRYATRFRPHRRDIPYRDEDDPYFYRRESFSGYRDATPIKKSRSTMDVREPHEYSYRRSSTGRGPSKSNKAEKSPPRPEYSSESEDSPNTDIESDQESVISEAPQQDVNVDMNQLIISADYKTMYHNRMEMIYDTLPDQLTRPPPIIEETASMARGEVTVKQPIDSLPVTNFIPAKFKAQREKYKKAFKTVEAKDIDESGQEVKKKVKVLSTKKVKLGLEDDVFHPKWLYNIDQPKWFPKMEMDDDIFDMIPDGAKPIDKFKLDQHEINNIQHACSIALNASNHLDWMLSTVRQKSESLYDPKVDANKTLTDIKDMIKGLAWANEFLAGQFIYIHSGFTHLMRKENIKQMEDIKEPEIRDLYQQPFDVAPLFNGQLSKIVEKRSQRRTSKAMRNLGESNAVPDEKPKSSSRSNREKTVSSKVNNKTQFGDFDKHGKRSSNKGKSNWNKTQKDPPTNFLFSKGSKGTKPKKPFPKRRNNKKDSNYR